MTKRKPVSKKVRFEVFKRDSFTCQYCGCSAPDVVLHVDHISPVAGGGCNDIMNLVTSCIDCNLGKGAKKLSDKSIIQKQKLQLDEINEKRNQLELMLRWREEINNLQNIQIDHIEKIIFKEDGLSLSEYGRGEMAKVIKKHGLDEVISSAEISRSQYAEFKEGRVTAESIEKVINYIPKIANNRKKAKENPGLYRLYYIRAIVRNRMYCNEHRCLELLRQGIKSGVTIDEMTMIAKTARNWTDWQQEMYEVI